jgi:hypothetical protein
MAGELLDVFSSQTNFAVAVVAATARKTDAKRMTAATEQVLFVFRP